MAFVLSRKKERGTPVALSAGGAFLYLRPPAVGEARPPPRAPSPSPRLRASDVCAETPATCPECGKEFASITGYQYHVRRVCRVDPEDDPLRSRRARPHEPPPAEAVGEESIASPSPLIPVPSPSRQIIWCAGPQNSGKSWIAAQFIKAWIAMTGRPVILVSVHERDKTFDEAGVPESKLIRMAPDMSWVGRDFNIHDFSDALMVFDDVEGNFSHDPDLKGARHENAEIRARLDRLILDIQQNGRHCGEHGIYMLLTSHVLYDRHRTAAMLADATDFILFPATTGHAAWVYFLKTYAGLDAGDIEAARRLPSRWILVHKNAPRYFLWDHGAARFDM